MACETELAERNAASANVTTTAATKVTTAATKATADAADLAAAAAADAAEMILTEKQQALDMCLGGGP